MRSSINEVMSNLNGLDFGLLLIGFGLLLVFLIPVFISSAGILVMRHRCDGEEVDRLAVHPDGTNPDYSARFDELEQLGFQPAGMVYEEVWFSGHEFYKSFPVRVLVSPDGLTHSTLYDLGWGGVVRVGLDSVTDQGRFIQTAMPGAGIQADDVDYYRTEIESGPVSGLLEKHLREVGKCLQKSGGRLARVSLAERTALDEKISRRLMSGIGQGASGVTFVALGWGIPFGIAAAVLMTGFDLSWPRAIGVASVTAAPAYLLFVFKLLPAFHRLLERVEVDPPCRRC